MSKELEEERREKENLLHMTVNTIEPDFDNLLKELDVCLKIPTIKDFVNANLGLLADS